MRTPQQQHFCCGNPAVPCHTLALSDPLQIVNSLGQGICHFILPRTEPGRLWHRGRAINAITPQIWAASDSRHPRPFASALARPGLPGAWQGRRAPDGSGRPQVGERRAAQSGRSPSRATPRAPRRAPAGRQRLPGARRAAARQRHRPSAAVRQGAAAGRLEGGAEAAAAAGSAQPGTGSASAAGGSGERLGSARLGTGRSRRAAEERSDAAAAAPEKGGRRRRRCCCCCCCEVKRSGVPPPRPPPVPPPRPVWPCGRRRAPAVAVAAAAELLPAAGPGPALPAWAPPAVPGRGVRPAGGGAAPRRGAAGALPGRLRPRAASGAVAGAPPLAWPCSPCEGLGAGRALCCGRGNALLASGLRSSESPRA